MAGVALRAPSSAARPGRIAGAVVLAGLVAWLVTADRMAGMDAGPGTDLGGFAWFAGAWATMMAAMMFPSVAPTVKLFARTAGALGCAPFIAGYLAVWTAFGMVAYGLDRVVVALDPEWLAWDRAGPYVAGAAIAAAGVYELTPLKALCLRHCRSPMHFLLARWRPGAVGAFTMGARHGSWCAGCCGALMVVLFATGVMSVFWMVAIALVIAAEKLLPRARAVTRVVAIALIALGLLVAFVPERVPQLTEPRSMTMDEQPAMQGDPM
jgi:predicted metal-binding membrane protein